MRASSLSLQTGCTSGTDARIGPLLCALLGAGVESLRSAAADMQDPATRRDPEVIHQARVAVRRMRAALHVFGKPLARRVTAKPLRRAEKALGKIGRALGEARDWDVIVLSLLPAQAAALTEVAGKPGLGPVRRGAQLARMHANTAARRFVSGAEFEHLLARVTALQQVLEKSVFLPDAAARRALDRQDAAVRRLGSRLAQLGRRQRHRLRIEAKRLRYAVELCAPLFAARGRKQWINALKGLQSVLGTVTDAHALADRVGSLGAEAAIARRLDANARNAVRGQLPQAAALFMVLRLARAPWKA